MGMRCESCQKAYVAEKPPHYRPITTDEIATPRASKVADSLLWQRVRSALEPVLDEIAKRRRERPPTIEVVCDESNNTAEDLERGVLNYRLRFHPDRATETEREAWRRLGEGA